MRACIALAHVRALIRSPRLAMMRFASATRPSAKFNASKASCSLDVRIPRAVQRAALCEQCSMTKSVNRADSGDHLRVFSPLPVPEAIAHRIIHSL